MTSGEEQMATLQTAEPARHADPTVRAQRLAYLVWERPDLERAEAFHRAFGLVVAERNPDALYLRAAAAAPFCAVLRRGPQARFVGLALEVASRGDLERLTGLAGASPIEPLGTPGGGEVVRLRDPAGFLVEVVYGQTACPALPMRDALRVNTAGAHPRVNDGQRPPVAPPAVCKLGHVVLEVADYQATSRWYTEHFGLIPSDVQVLPDGSPAITFFRLDRGATPADHHTLALGQGFAARFNHAAFEVVDQDAVGMGQRMLREKGYRHAWGIGRHLLGSQIFDYWHDPWGDKHEHYCDGDVFTADAPTGISFAARSSLLQWGPPLPASFIRPKLGATDVADLLRNLWRSPDLSVRKLVTMARLLA
jgi:catechol 2,3-dioxygenase-like lactoylglutathione lyase family enzyme